MVKFGHIFSDGPSDTSGDSSQQQDWSLVWECFEKPQTLLQTTGGGLSKVMQVNSYT